MVASETPPLEIIVEADIRLPAQVPKKLLAALRRQLRAHACRRLSERYPERRDLVTLLSERDGEVVLAQGLLARLTDICRRQDIPYTVSDQRTLAMAPVLRCSLPLSDEQQKALRRLLLQDSGIFLSPQSDERIALAMALVARRQQRTLVVAGGAAAADQFAAQVAEGLSLEPLRLSARSTAAKESTIAVGIYQEALKLPLSQLDGFGLVVFDAIDTVDPLTMLRLVRGARARYLLGLAATSAREDGLDGALYLSLGGVTAELQRPRDPRPVDLSLRQRVTTFSFDYRGREHYQALLAALAHNTPRNAQIAQDIVQEAKTGQPCLVLSERRDHLEHLAAVLPATVAAERLDSSVRPAQRATLLTRFAQREFRVLLVTGHIASEALTAIRASRLFICFPFSYVQKLEKIARVVLQPSDHERDALIYDYDDFQIAPLHRAFTQRARVLGRLQKTANDAYARWAQLELRLSD